MKDVQLWFANDLDSDDLDICYAPNASLNKNYLCPVCGSKVVPKGTKDGALVAPHFAHVNKDMCSTESMIHWWFKNKFICVG
ncbi:MAG: competence protein CoiA family protein, partial [Peptostreptococcaceae bacterium]